MRKCWGLGTGIWGGGRTWGDARDIPGPGPEVCEMFVSLTSAGGSMRRRLLWGANVGCRWLRTEVGAAGAGWQVDCTVAGGSHSEATLTSRVWGSIEWLATLNRCPNDAGTSSWCCRWDGAENRPKTKEIISLWRATCAKLINFSALNTPHVTLWHKEPA